MSKRRPLPDPDRRKFLKGATLAGAIAITPPVAATAQGVAPVAAPRADLKAAAPGPNHCPDPAGRGPQAPRRRAI